MSKYWRDRKSLMYYHVAMSMLWNTVPKGSSILDIGGNVSGGCKYLAGLSAFDRTAVELQEGNETIPGVKLHFSKFEDWNPPIKYAAAICLQCIEHVDDPASFMAKIRRTAALQIISVPLDWRETPGHQHNRITLGQLYAWAGDRLPDKQCICDEPKTNSFALGAGKPRVVALWWN